MSKNAGWGRILSYYTPHWAIAIMILLAIMNAITMPVIGFVITQQQFAFYSRGSDPDWESDTIMFLCIQWAVVVWILIVASTERAIFGVMGEKLTQRIRLKILEEIMHKQVSWFDREDRAPGIITTILSSDLVSLNGLTSEVIVTIFELVFVTIIGLVGGIYLCWQAAILCFALSPIMVIGSYMMITMQFGMKGGKHKGMDGEVSAYEKANALLSDIVINYRTVISLGQKNVDSLNEKFESLLQGPMDQLLSQTNKAGLYYGLGTSGRTIYVSLVFLIAIEVLVAKWGIDSTDVFTASYLLFFVMMSLGSQAAQVPSI